MLKKINIKSTLANTIKYLIVFIVIWFASFKATQYANSKMNQVSSEIITGDWSKYGVNEISPIVIYTKKGCSACASLKNYLANHEITYMEKEISSSNTFMMEWESLDTPAYPVALVRDKKIVGNRPKEIITALKAVHSI